MMRPTTRRTLLLALFSVATAIVLTNGLRADDAKVTGDLKKMQGVWVNDGDGPELRWVIDGQSLKATVNGSEYVCTIKLDPKAEPIPTADLTIKEGPGDSAGKTSRAIYKFDGEKMILCITHPGGDDRPTEFKATEEKSFLFTLKKDK